MNVLDSVNSVDPTAARSLGFSGIGRYCPVPGAQFALTPSELALYTAAVFPVFLAVELDPGAPSNLGAPGGTQYAQWAVAGARSLGVPKGAALFMSNDAVVTDWPNVLAFYAAFAPFVNANGYAASFYGQSSVWEQVRGFGLEYFWHAPDGTDPPWPPGTNIVQLPPAQGITIAGRGYDIDEVLTEHFGAFTSKGLWPVSVEDPMYLVKVKDPDNAAGKVIYWLLSGGVASPIAGATGDLAELQRVLPQSQQVTLTWATLKHFA